MKSSNTNSPSMCAPILQIILFITVLLLVSVHILVQVSGFNPIQLARKHILPHISMATILIAGTLQHSPFSKSLDRVSVTETATRQERILFQILSKP